MPRPLVLALAAVSLGTALWLPSGESSAQQRAALELTVTDAVTGQPLRGATVVLAGYRSATDAAGKALAADLPAGAIAGEVTHMGYARRSFTIPVAAGATLSLDIPMQPSPIELRPVEVNAKAVPGHGARAQHLKDFYQRAESGPGYYITRAQIESWHPRQISDLFRMVPGLGLVRTASGERAQFGTRSAPTYDALGRLKECPIQYFVDGTPYESAGSEALYLDLRPEDIEGLEVYTGTVGLPAQFRRTNRNCGVILIWKRERI